MILIEFPLAVLALVAFTVFVMLSHVPPELVLGAGLLEFFLLRGAFRERREQSWIFALLAPQLVVAALWSARCTLVGSLDWGGVLRVIGPDLEIGLERAALVSALLLTGTLILRRLQRPRNVFDEIERRPLRSALRLQVLLLLLLASSRFCLATSSIRVFDATVQHDPRNLMYVDLPEAYATCTSVRNCGLRAVTELIRLPGDLTWNIVRPDSQDPAISSDPLNPLDSTPVRTEQDSVHTTISTTRSEITTEWIVRPSAKATTP